MANECQYCYFWKGDRTSTYADCDKTGHNKKYNEDCDCGKYSKR